MLPVMNTLNPVGCCWLRCLNFSCHKGVGWGADWAHLGRRSEPYGLLVCLVTRYWVIFWAFAWGSVTI